MSCMRNIPCNDENNNNTNCKKTYVIFCQGPRGATGPTGPAGPMTIAVGRTITTNPGEEASVINRGHQKT